MVNTDLFNHNSSYNKMNGFIYSILAYTWTSPTDFSYSKRKRNARFQHTGNWNQEPTGWHIFKIQKIPNNLTVHRNINKSSQTFGARIWIGHLVMESYLNRFYLADSSIFRVCNKEEDTIEHRPTLLNCTKQCEERHHLQKLVKEQRRGEFHWR